MNLSLIAAVGKNYELGMNNKLIWYLPSDLKFFKKMTLNKTVVMGANTYYSIGKPLVNRTNIVITHKVIPNVILYSDIRKFLEDYKNIEDEVFIIGGASIYNQFIEYANQIYLTEINKEEFKADTYFPSFDKSLYDSSIIDELVENDIRYKHVLYKKKNREDV